jgi:hypothetical protein
MLWAFDDMEILEAPSTTGRIGRGWAVGAYVNCLTKCLNQMQHSKFQSVFHCECCQGERALENYFSLTNVLGDFAAFSHARQVNPQETFLANHDRFESALSLLEHISSVVCVR